MFKINNRRFKAILCMLVVIVAGMSVPAQAGIVKTDIVMIVDESGSMSNVHSNLGNSIGLFASILQAGGLDAQFALVGYGFAGDNIRLLTDFVDATTFAGFTGDLYSIGSNEPAYDATAYALDGLTAESAGLSYRADAVKNLILFADEASNSDTEYDANSLDGLLQQSSALFNVVLGGTFSDLLTLAANNGGHGFDLNELNTSDTNALTAFVTNFAQVKLQETLDYCVANPNDPACVGGGADPVPAPWGLGFMVMALAIMRVRR